MSLKAKRIEAQKQECPSCFETKGFDDNGDSVDLTFCCNACKFLIDACDLLPSIFRKRDQRNADRIDGYDRDDLGESPDY